jgi:hypothetical protein
MGLRVGVTVATDADATTAGGKEEIAGEKMEMALVVVGRGRLCLCLLADLYLA